MYHLCESKSTYLNVTLIPKHTPEKNQNNAGWNILAHGPAKLVQKMNQHTHPFTLILYRITQPSSFLFYFFNTGRLFSFLVFISLRIHDLWNANIECLRANHVIIEYVFRQLQEKVKVKLLLNTKIMVNVKYKLLQPWWDLSWLTSRIHWDG